MINRNKPFFNFFMEFEKIIYFHLISHVFLSDDDESSKDSY